MNWGFMLPVPGSIVFRCCEEASFLSTAGGTVSEITGTTGRQRSD
jgi:hypothetical protein